MEFSDDEVERYARQLVLAEIGGPGQQKLKASSVLIVGCGGVGGPAALYLAAAGVGRLGLVDPDTVALSNLQRQVQFATADIGRAKPAAAAERLAHLNPHIAVEPIQGRFDAATGRALAARFDVVLDGTDDFETRLAVNDACLAEGRPLVSGALGRWTGQVGVFTGRPCYRCLVPEAPPGAETCARVGVIGALAGVIGSMATLECIKLITGAGRPLTGRLLVYDALTTATRTARIQPDPGCRACG
ncbi:molybdopterin-synthase adenylyltransferase MoeB [Brevundimonas sp.]|uniref:HesA/MoeB/ThiF family protein n=1 Tax=Brevundimonas sp. TaxID=1871086 RepID=UPI0025F5C91F|nr:molybdopterin-synthase adenylyltransferase MoeB [Brevundimonas sp.]